MLSVALSSNRRSAHQISVVCPDKEICNVATRLKMLEGRYSGLKVGTSFAPTFLFEVPNSQCTVERFKLKKKRRSEVGLKHRGRRKRKALILLQAVLQFLNPCSIGRPQSNKVF